MITKVEIDSKESYLERKLNLLPAGPRSSVIPEQSEY